MTRLSIPHSDYSPEMHALLCDPCPRCGTCMGDDAHDDLDVWVCDTCCTACRLTFSDEWSVVGPSDGGGDRSPRPEQVTATTSANEETP